LGETRNSRVTYENNTLEIMAPLPENETAKVIIIDLLKVLMGELEIEFWPLGSRTFKNELMEQGIEPYDCFSIENEA
jgi:Uma2 family endonuclease